MGFSMSYGVNICSDMESSSSSRSDLDVTLNISHSFLSSLCWSCSSVLPLGNLTLNLNIKACTKHSINSAFKVWTYFLVLTNAFCPYISLCPKQNQQNEIISFVGKNSHYKIMLLLD